MDVEQQVKIKYPKLLEERTCRLLREKRNWLREKYRQELNEQSAATSIQREERKADKIV